MSSSPTYSSASISHVVNENGNLVLDITNEDHAADNVGTRSLLVDEGKGRVETVSDGCGTLGTTGIGRDDDTVLDVQVLADPSQDGGLCVEVVHGDVEETLDLRGVEIHGDDMVLSQVLKRADCVKGSKKSTYATGDLEHIGDELGADGCSRLVLFILTGIREVALRRI